jgi:hypothetical protein
MILPAGHINDDDLELYALDCLADDAPVEGTAAVNLRWSPAPALGTPPRKLFAAIQPSCGGTTCLPPAWRGSPAGFGADLPLRRDTAALRAFRLEKRDN